MSETSSRENNARVEAVTSRDLGDAPGMARVKANLFVNTWQGAIVVARAGEGLEHIGRVFRYLKEIVPLSC